MKTGPSESSVASMDVMFRGAVFGSAARGLQVPAVHDAAPSPLPVSSQPCMSTKRLRMSQTWISVRQPRKCITLAARLGCRPEAPLEGERLINP